MLQAQHYSRSHCIYCQRQERVAVPTSVAPAKNSTLLSVPSVSVALALSEIFEPAGEIRAFKWRRDVYSRFNIGRIDVDADRARCGCSPIIISGNRKQCVAPRSDSAGHVI